MIREGIRQEKSVPVGITMGCPAGIGPEIIIKFFTESMISKSIRSVVIGDINVLSAARDRLGQDFSIKPWQPGNDITQDVLHVFETSSLDPTSIRPGNPDTAAGHAAAQAITESARLCLNGDIKSISTCPIAKKPLNDAGYKFPGHTEFYADLCGKGSAVMMMAGTKLNVILATIHCPYREVPDLLSVEKLEKLIQTADKALTHDFAIKKPIIGVAGLNPHGGEEGMFGTEEEKIILPAVNNCQRRGIEVVGPFPPDTVFYQGAKGRYNCIICMYHDQGLIPFKMLHFSDGVNVTLGLPIVRTSVDHGTAYDIAGQGIADYRSLEAAVALADTIANNRARRD